MSSDAQQRGIILSLTNGYSGRTASSLNGSENHELCIIGGYSEDNVCHQINNKGPNEHRSSTSYIRYRTPKCWTDSLNYHHVYCDCQGGKGDGDVQCLFKERSLGEPSQSEEGRGECIKLTLDTSPRAGKYMLDDNAEKIAASDTINTSSSLRDCLKM